MSKTTAPAWMTPLRGVNPIIVSFLVLGLAAMFWIPHLGSSLLLDETLTFWVIRDGLSETLDRALRYQPQPAYYLFMWAWVQGFGISETALRLPSVIAALAACVAMAKLGEHLTRDRETGLIAAIVLATSWNVFRESVDARSYMLGLAILLLLALSLIRWIRLGEWRDVWLSGICAGLLPQLHLFFALTYPAFALLAWLRWSQGRAEVKQLLLLGVLLLVGAGLFFPVGEMLLAHGGSYSFVPRPSWASLFRVFLWTAPILGTLAGLVVFGILKTSSSWSKKIDEETLEPNSLPVGSAALLASWILVPLFLLFAVSMLTDLSVFLGRYLIPAIPALCLVYAIVLRRIPIAVARLVAVFVIVIVSVVMHERPYDDFRGAAAVVNQFVAEVSASGEETPVLLATGLIETEDVKWLRDPSVADYLRAPTKYYPIDGRLITLPRQLADHLMAERIVWPVLDNADRFAVVEWFGNGARALRWIRSRAKRAGFVGTPHSFGGVRVMLFTRVRNQDSVERGVMDRMIVLNDPAT